jgi:Tissue inhibitor of metalloproteinase
MRVRRLAVVTALVVLGALGFSVSAQACSCAPLSPRESLRQSDAAIVGRLVEVRPRGRLHAEYRYEVQRVYRGPSTIEPGQMLGVQSARRAAACALPRRLGHRYGLFLARADGRWFSGICGVIEPRRLWHAAQRQSPDRRPGADGSPAGDCAA